MRGRILLASTLALAILAFTHPAWALRNGDFCVGERIATCGTQYPEISSFHFLGVMPQASLPDALDAFYAHPVDPGEVVVMWLGNGVGSWSGYASSGILLKTDGKVVLIDPANIISGSNVQKLQRLDVLLITHEHTDHFSQSATSSIQSQTGAVIVANPGAYTQLTAPIPHEKLIKMKSTQTQVVSGIEITAIASDHPGNEPLTYLLTMSPFSIYHGSDSGPISALEGYKGRARLALMPTGIAPTASPDAALQMVRALQPNDVIPMHGSESDNARLGTLLTQQAPNVQYHRPQPISSLAVDEFLPIGLIAILVSVTEFSLIMTTKRQERE